MKAIVATTIALAVTLFRNLSVTLQLAYALAFEPGDEQRNLIAHTLERIQSGERLCLFPGAAGTGKTTTLKLLLRVLRDCGLTVSVATPTHKAAKRAQEQLQGEDVTVVTLYSIVYAGAEEIREEDEDGNVAEFGEELDFNKRDAGTASVGRILIVDEASMVGESLANDMWQAIPTSTQVIAVGDPHQLPPVGEAAGFPLSEATVELSKVYRQADASPVLKAATQIRSQRVPFTWSKVADWRTGAQILQDSGVDSRWMDPNRAGDALAAMIRRTDGDAAAIVGTHKSRVVLNDLTRKHLGFDRRVNGPQPGERLICRAGGAGLRNADIVTVKTVEAVDFGRRFGDGWVLTVAVEGSKWDREIAVLRETWDGDCAPKHRGLVPFSVRKNMDEWIDTDAARYGEQISRRVNELVEGYEARKGVHPSEWLISMMEARAARECGAWALYLRRFLAAVDSGYAITCHAAQGSQYREIIVVADCVDFIADGDKENVYRWSYTALTRAVENALVVCKRPNTW